MTIVRQNLIKVIKFSLHQTKSPCNSKNKSTTFIAFRIESRSAFPWTIYLLKLLGMQVYCEAYT